MTHYAVAWQPERGQTHVGRLELGANGLRLEGGRHRSGRLSSRRLLYRNVVEAKMAPIAERIGGRPTIQLRSANDVFFVAPFGAGLTRELLRLVQLDVESAAP